MLSSPGKHCHSELQWHTTSSDHKYSVGLRVFVWQSLVCLIRAQIVIFHRFQPSVLQDMPQVHSSIPSRMLPGGKGIINPTKFKLPTVSYTGEV